jgi:uncharacterized membrane-anchored protein YhcB (DUF1043 family)
MSGVGVVMLAVLRFTLRAIGITIKVSVIVGIMVMILCMRMLSPRSIPQQPTTQGGSRN